MEYPVEISDSLENLARKHEHEVAIWIRQLKQLVDQELKPYQIIGIIDLIWNGIPQKVRRRVLRTIERLV